MRKVEMRTFVRLQTTQKMTSSLCYCVHTVCIKLWRTSRELSVIEKEIIDIRETILNKKQKILKNGEIMKN